MRQILVRNVPEETHRKIKATAAMQGVSVNTFVLDLIESASSNTVVTIVKSEDLAASEKELADSKK